jgi:hypothetical protein
MARYLRRLELAQLAVLATAAVVSGEVGGVPIVTLLAGDAKAHAGYCSSARLRYFRTTVCTLTERVTLRQSALSSPYAVLDGRVDLLIDRIVSCPASSHVTLLKKASACRCDIRGKWLLLKHRCPGTIAVRHRLSSELHFRSWTVRARPGPACRDFRYLTLGLR